jgi:hypothetical protein
MNFATRRSFISASILTLASLSRSFSKTPKPGREVDTNTNDLRNQWMDAWMSRSTEQLVKGVSGGLYLSRFAEPVYFLVRPIRWFPSQGQPRDLPNITVPVGFVTDLASIPRIFWTMLRPDGEYAYAAIIHDYLYWTQVCSRDVADQVFYYAMIDFKIPLSLASMIFQAVREFGLWAWKSNIALKKNGERRLLRRMPSDPTVRWEEWKKELDVFR